MKISLDTNVLVRLIVGDDDLQQTKATEVLDAAELVAISVHTLCEFAWVLQSNYKVARVDLAQAIHGILEMRNVVANRPTIEAGLSILDAGGDFADGVIAFDGRWLGAETFVSFDRNAVNLLTTGGISAISLV